MKAGSDIAGQAIKLRQQWEQLRLYEQEIQTAKNFKEGEAIYRFLKDYAAQAPGGTPDNPNWRVAVDQHRDMTRLMLSKWGVSPTNQTKAVQNFVTGPVDIGWSLDMRRARWNELISSGQYQWDDDGSEDFDPKNMPFDEDLIYEQPEAGVVPDTSKKESGEKKTPSGGTQPKQTQPRPAPDLSALSERERELIRTKNWDEYRGAKKKHYQEDIGGGEGYTPQTNFPWATPESVQAEEEKRDISTGEIIKQMSEIPDEQKNSPQYRELLRQLGESTVTKQEAMEKLSYYATRGGEVHGTEQPPEIYGPEDMGLEPKLKEDRVYGGTEVQGPVIKSETTGDPIKNVAPTPIETAISQEGAVPLRTREDAWTEISNLTTSPIGYAVSKLMSGEMETAKSRFEKYSEGAVISQEKAETASGEEARRLKADSAKKAYKSMSILEKYYSWDVPRMKEWIKAITGKDDWKEAEETWRTMMPDVMEQRAQEIKIKTQMLQKDRVERDLKLLEVQRINAETERAKLEMEQEFMRRRLEGMAEGQAGENMEGILGYYAATDFPKYLDIIKDLGNIELQKHRLDKLLIDIDNATLNKMSKADDIQKRNSVTSTTNKMAEHFQKTLTQEREYLMNEFLPKMDNFSFLAKRWANNELKDKDIPYEHRVAINYTLDYLFRRYPNWAAATKNVRPGGLTWKEKVQIIQGLDEANVQQQEAQLSGNGPQGGVNRGREDVDKEVEDFSQRYNLE
jgi:hypothetical protein